MVYCEATIEEKMLQDNLMQCIEILGGEPQLNENTVSVYMDKGNKDIEMAQLFMHFSVYNLYIQITT